MICRHGVATIAALLLLSPINLTLIQVNGLEISYVMEPFDGPNPPISIADGDSENFKVSLTDQSYAGSYALQVQYANPTNNSLTLNISGIEEKRPHICVGATHISFWYHYTTSSAIETSDPLGLRLTLYDDSECARVCASSPEVWDHWTTSFRVLEHRADWQEVRVSLADLAQSNPDSTGNNKLDLHRLRGFLFELKSAQLSIGKVKLDQLSFIGAGDLMGAALFASSDFNQTVATEGGWTATAFNSPLSSSESRAIMDNQNGTLEIDYLVQHSADWGGFLSYAYLAPGPAYYNVSNATSVTFTYQVNEPVSEPERLHLRFTLVDSSECFDDCDESNTEHYYSFHYILGAIDSSTKQLSIHLQGSTNSFDPFWLTGWSGVLGNQKLDPQNLKGYIFEFSMDYQGNLSSTASGAITFSGMEAVDSNTTIDNGHGVNSTCVEEPGIAYNGFSPVFKKKEFVGDRCCDICDIDPTCIYVLSTGRDCFLASRLAVDAIGLEVPPVGDYTVIRTVILKAYWMDSAQKRGDFCDLCVCDEDTMTIDCRGKELAVVPKTFNMTFTPRVVDLRENSDLVLLGSGSLADIAGGLEVLWLPKNMIHLGANSLTNLPKLREVRFEGQEESSSTTLIKGNVISRPNDFFGSVCCARGNQINLTFPEQGLTWCDYTHVNVEDPPGIDSIYLPFTRYIDPTILDVLFPTSSFMSEAAASVETCAEYCTIVQSCRFFSYDNRVSNAESICLFLGDEGGGEETICCDPGEYADEAMTEPGWTSGRPPASRRILDNATVLVEPRALLLNPDNNYETYFEISLGASPLRGAVHVTSFMSDDKGLNVTFWPTKFALYDANSTTKVHVMVSNVEAGAPSRVLEILNIFESCDHAFTSVESSSEESNVVSINVSIPLRFVEEDDLAPLSYVAMVLGGLVFLMVIVTAAMVEKNKAKRAVRYAQIEFLRLLLAGSLMTSIGAILVGGPPNDGTCLAAVWLVEVGYSLELVPLIVKIAAINQLMAAAAQMRRITLQKRNLFGAVALILTLVLVFLTLWSVLDRPQKVADVETIVDPDGYTTVTTTFYCSGHHTVWAIICGGWNAVLLLSASVLAFQTSKIKRPDFNESQTLAFLIYSHFVFVVLQLALFPLFNEVQESTLNQVRSLLISMDRFAALGIYFLPKFLAKDNAVPPRDTRVSGIVTTIDSTIDPLRTKIDSEVVRK